MKLLHLAIVLSMGIACFAAKARYDNYKLYSMQLSTEEQAKAVEVLAQNVDSYDFWSDTSLVRDVDVMIPPHKLGEFEDFLTRFNITFHVKVENIQKYVDEIQLMTKLTHKRNSLSFIITLGSLTNKIPNSFYKEIPKPETYSTGLVSIRSLK